MDLNRSAAGGEVRGQLFRSDIQPGPLTGPVRYVDESAAAAKTMIERSMVAKVRGDVHVGHLGSSLEIRVASSSAHRDRPNDQVGVAGDANALGRLRQNVGNPRGELRE